jgi:hypothetical protein
MKLKWSIFVATSLMMFAALAWVSVLRPSSSVGAQSVPPAPAPLVEGPGDAFTGSVTLAVDVLAGVPGAEVSILTENCTYYRTVQGSIAMTTPVQEGRLVRDPRGSTCAERKPFPGLQDTDYRHATSHWFNNSSETERCYVVEVQEACIGAHMVQFTTYLNRYSGADPAADYLADMGSSPNPTGTYSFIVPARAGFGVVVNEVNHGEGCEHYAFTVKPCDCWEVSITGYITNTDSTQTGRLVRNGQVSDCQRPQPFPGVYGSDTIHYDRYSLLNQTGASQCYRVDVSAPNCRNGHIFVAAYLGPYDPANLSANYLANIGASPLPSRPFSFQVPVKEPYTLVVNEVTAGAGCSDYTLRITNCGYQVCLPDLKRGAAE